MSTTSQLFCPQCGAAHPLHAKFCRLCGIDLHVDETGQDVVSNVSRVPLSAPDIQAQNASVQLQSSQQGILLKQRYRIRAQVGSGGYGEVYKAADTQFGDRLVAVKEMSQRGLGAQEIAEATEAFKHEAFMLAALTHPNLPSIYDYFTENARWYLVMSYIEGETLEDYLQRTPGGRLSVEKVLNIGSQLGSVLNYLHTRNPPIIFRDLKPANVMRTHDGLLYLIDFGIARHFKHGKTKDTMILGSPGYAAPEQYGRAQTTPQTDVYSLGSMLHHLLSGADPALSPFSHAPLALPDYPALSHLIMCMLDTDAKKRPASMGNIKRELQRMMSGRSRELAAQPGPKQQHPGPSSVVPYNHNQVPINAPQSAQQRQKQLLLQYYPQQPASAHRQIVKTVGIIGTLGSLFSCAVAAITGHTVNSANATLAYAQPTYHISNPIPLPPTSSFTPPPEALLALAWSPDGQRIASANVTNGVQVRDAENQHIIFNSGQPVSNPGLAWSPDGYRIASVGNQPTVQIWDATIGKLLYTYHGHTRSVQTLAWSPEGHSIASVDSNNTVRVWDAVTYQTLQVYTGQKQRITSLAWSPDSKRIASASIDGVVSIWDALSGQQLPGYIHLGVTITSVAWSPDGKLLALGCTNRTVQVWDTLTDSAVMIYEEQQDRITSLTWSPDSKRIASAAWDKTVRVWDATTGENSFAYTEHNQPVLSVAWSLDGKRIASGDVGGDLRIWSPPQ